MDEARSGLPDRTADDQSGGPRDNLKLSQDRAKSVSDYLQKSGVNPARMQTDGFGGERGIKPNDTEANRAANRRIEFKLRKE